MTGRVIDVDGSPTLSDDEVIKASFNAPESFAVIFDRHGSAIHTYLARRIGITMAEDLTGETFLIAFRRRQKYNFTETSARPWLYGIATNLLRRERRVEIRQYRALARTGVDPAFDGLDEEVLGRVAAEDQVRRLASALASLSAREREVLTLVAQAQLSYAEVSAALGIPIGTVRSRLHSARQRIFKTVGYQRPRPEGE